MFLQFSFPSILAINKISKNQEAIGDWPNQSLHLVNSLIWTSSFQASTAASLCSAVKTANIEDLFARLDVVDKNLQGRFAKFQERKRQQLDSMHSDIESLRRINAFTHDDIFVQEMGKDEEDVLIGSSPSNRIQQMCQSVAANNGKGSR